MGTRSWFANRHGDVIETFAEGRARSERSARAHIDNSTILRPGETLGEAVENRYPGQWKFRVNPPVILTLAEVRAGTGFPKGTRFMVLPPEGK